MQVKVRVGDYKYKVGIEFIDHKRLKLSFPYNRALIEEVKVMEGAKWHGFDTGADRGKYWTISDSQRNWFQLHYLQGLNPYKHYDQSLIEYTGTGKEFDHQIDGIKFVLTRKQCILAMEMGTGKTLIAIRVLEHLGLEDGILWAGPKTALYAVQYEFAKWKCKIKPHYYTYESLKRLAQTDFKFKAVIFDECQKIKTPVAQRSQAAKYIADKVRENDGIILLMSGTPAPKNPGDWWHLCEVACPGYIREGSQRKFIDRLAFVTQEENTVTGGMFKKLVSWKDDENKCAECGRLGHYGGEDHEYKKSKDEVRFLYKRMAGLVKVCFKKDVLKDLPEINFRTIECTPTEATLRAEKLILKTAKRAIEALIQTRELSDGFQYKETESDERATCELCHGKRTILHPRYVGPEEIEQRDRVFKDELWETSEEACPYCNATGSVTRKVRTGVRVPTPKDKILEELLDEYEDVGRVVIYGGFTETVDKICELVKREGWHFIRVDGRGWVSTLMDYKDPRGMLKIFQEDQDLYPKVVFVAQPSSGGIGLTLTAAPVEIFYSNDFNLDSRLQAVARCHRPGMDLNRGLTVVDLIHLKTDQKVLDNLNAKKDLMNLTMGNLREETEGIRYF
jgi:SNF2 family DNA or RNA helicase